MLKNATVFNFASLQLSEATHAT